jgi:hypothetical protein
MNSTLGGTRCHEIQSPNAYEFKAWARLGGGKWSGVPGGAKEARETRSGGKRIGSEKNARSRSAWAWRPSSCSSCRSSSAVRWYRSSSRKFTTQLHSDAHLSSVAPAPAASISPLDPAGLPRSSRCSSLEAAV